MRTGFVLFLICIFIWPCIGQNDSLSMKRNFWGKYKYSLNGENISKTDVQSILESKPEAYEFIKKGKKKFTVSDIVNFTGGFLIGYAAADAIFTSDRDDKEFRTPFLAAGAALSIVGLINGIGAQKSIDQGVQLFNGVPLEIGEIPNLRKTKYKIALGTMKHGLGMQFSF